MANTTWSTTDKTASTTLTGGNLIATNNGGGAGATVRAIDKQVTGKLYFEYTFVINVSNATGAGIMASTVSLANLGFTNVASGMCGVVHNTGTIYVDGVATSASFNLGTIANGTVICIAVNCDARLIWFRSGAAGNWNNTASASPATGSGGIPILLGRGIPIYPAAVVFNTSDQITANFGDSAFTGAVPSGFTAGFTTGVTSSTNTLATQAALEEWITTNPPAQVTQVAIEEWASVQNAPPRVYTGVLSGSRAGIGSAVVSSTTALLTPHVVGIGVVGMPVAILPATRVTQVALEEWSSVALASTTEAWVTQVALEEWANVPPTVRRAANTAVTIMV